MKPGGFSPHLCNSKSSNSGRVAAHFNELTPQIPTQHVTQSLLCHMYNPRHMWCLLPALLYLPKALLCLEKGKKKPIRLTQPLLVCMSGIQAHGFFLSFPPQSQLFTPITHPRHSLSLGKNLGFTQAQLLFLFSQKYFWYLPLMWSANKRA